MYAIITYVRGDETWTECVTVHLDGDEGTSDTAYCTDTTHCNLQLGQTEGIIEEGKYTGDDDWYTMTIFSSGDEKTTITFTRLLVDGEEYSDGETEYTWSVTVDYVTEANGRHMIAVTYENGKTDTICLDDYTFYYGTTATRTDTYGKIYYIDDRYEMVDVTTWFTFYTYDSDNKAYTELTLSGSLTGIDDWTDNYFGYACKDGQQTILYVVCSLCGTETSPHYVEFKAAAEHVVAENGYTDKVSADCTHGGYLIGDCVNGCGEKDVYMWTENRTEKTVDDYYLLINEEENEYALYDHCSICDEWERIDYGTLYDEEKWTPEFTDDDKIETNLDTDAAKVITIGIYAPESWDAEKRTVTGTVYYLEELKDKDSDGNTLYKVYTKAEDGAYVEVEGLEKALIYVTNGEATCKETADPVVGGYFYCDVCHKAYYIAMKPMHVEDETRGEVAVAATCTSKAMYYYECSLCGDVFAKEDPTDDAPIGHEFGLYTDETGTGYTQIEEGETYDATYFDFYGYYAADPSMVVKTQNADGSWSVEVLKERCIFNNKKAQAQLRRLNGLLGYDFPWLISAGNSRIMRHGH